MGSAIYEGNSKQKRKVQIQRELLTVRKNFTLPELCSRIERILRPLKLVRFSGGGEIFGDCLPYPSKTLVKLLLIKKLIKFKIIINDRQYKEKVYLD
jgi:hypothetical protein